jgi:CRISPR-associated protein (TIGR02584 family)
METYPRRILLAVAGLSPQIVTETLYALTQHPEHPFVPTEIHLVSTREGAERARLALLSEEPGWFRRLCRDYRLPEIRFDESCIHVIKSEDGQELDDIRSARDNRQAADAIAEIVRELTGDPNAALHVSIAGGRKTMGFYLGYALSLFGREQDRLSHALVSEPFESSWDFFYPTPYSRVIAIRDNKLADTAEAKVTLAEIPFVSLRHSQPERSLTGRASFTEAVAAARQALGPPSLILDLPNRRVQAGERAFSLPPAELALLAVFARRALTGQEPLAAPPKEVKDPAWAELYWRELKAIGGELAGGSLTEKALAKGMDGDYFSAHLSKLRKLLKQALGTAAEPYLIDDGTSRPRRYRLALPTEAVRFEGLENNERNLT